MNKYKCSICKNEFKSGDPGTTVIPYGANYCSGFCEREAGRRYDAYVDPLGWYSNRSIENYD